MTDLLKISLWMLIISFCCSCSIKITDENESNEVIGMYAGVLSTKLTEATAADLREGFEVYGGIVAAEPFQVFDGDTVKSANGIDWTYGTPKYWVNAAYDFHAVYPCGTSASYNKDNGDFTIGAYNIKENQDTDLMIAMRENHIYPDDGPTAELNFKHALVQVAFKGKTNSDTGGDPVKITSIKLYGVPSVGTYSSSAKKWTSDQATTSNSPFISKNEVITLTTAPQDVFGDYLLLFPVNPVPATYALEVKHSESNSSVFLELSSAALGSWEAGNKYVYTFTIIDKDLIIFDAPKVLGWTESNGNVIIVE